MAVGAYEAVWLFVGFDLPTLTTEDKRRATRFRNSLLDLGFQMFQLSFYSYYFTSKTQADSVASRIEGLVPPNGCVSIFFVLFSAENQKRMMYLNKGFCLNKK